MVPTHGSQMIYAIDLLIIAYAALACDPVLTRLFTPPHSQLGVYEVCSSETSIESTVEGLRDVRFGPIELVEPLEAFGGAGTYDPAKLARLYGGRRAKVARGWRDSGNAVESITLISPYPNSRFTTLERGTLIVSWRVGRGL